MKWAGGGRILMVSFSIVEWKCPDDRVRSPEDRERGKGNAELKTVGAPASRPRDRA
jgi:hypothetical protein